MSGGGSVRRYAEARGRILTAAARRVPLASIAQQARALSLWDGKRVVPGDEMQLALVLDLGVLDPLGGHARGIDRQAKADPPEPGSDDARMLAALQEAAFGLYRLRGPHAEGGAAAEGFPDGEPLRIHDNFLGRQPPGRLFGARLAWPEDGRGDDLRRRGAGRLRACWSGCCSACRRRAGRWRRACPRRRTRTRRRSRNCWTSRPRGCASPSCRAGRASRRWSTAPPSTSACSARCRGARPA